MSPNIAKMIGVANACVIMNNLSAKYEKLPSNMPANNLSAFMNMLMNEITAIAKTIIEINPIFNLILPPPLNQAYGNTHILSTKLISK